MLDFLFGSKQAQQTSTSQVQLPDYMEKAASSLVATAGDVAKENFIPYTGPRLAGFSDLEQQAMAQAQQGRGLGGLRGHKHLQLRQPQECQQPLTYQHI
tara:strand:+ start:367 stop:663 length:297 start_codon:yes stop_codon:yes gene_type:complete